MNKNTAATRNLRISWEYVSLSCSQNNRFAHGTNNIDDELLIDDQGKAPSHHDDLTTA
ncbi:hypothetical protein EV13_1969 [Prochlorococcus sp. MIT 0702]|nr:hypothetical protein EV13_1969 [Prochlorococcus sp. MIT 0702]